MNRKTAAAVKDWAMDYLAYKLIWWLLVALALGFVFGWVACGRRKSEP